MATTGNEIPASQLIPGMTIVERDDNNRRREIAVKKVVRSPEGCRHSVHVNGNACYARIQPVTITA